MLSDAWNSSCTYRLLGEDFNRKGYVDAALWLADMQDQGAIGHVGLTNFDSPHLIQVEMVEVGRGSNQIHNWTLQTTQCTINALAAVDL